MNTSHPKLMGKLLIETAVGNFLGDKRIRLLEAIAAHGSITQAAKAVPLSYKAAWDAVDDMNNLAPEPVVLRSAGGSYGGGTELTPFGKRLIAFYRALEQEYQEAVEKLASNLDHGGSADVSSFRQMLRSMSMKSSARNQFAGTIAELKDGAVDTEVIVRLDPELDLTAIITRESAENMGLKAGGKVLALVKASSILLLVEEDAVAISARNRFRGTIAAIHQGPVNAEVTLDLPGGRHVITDESVKRMGLAVGSPVTAAFKASSVFLASLD